MIALDKNELVKTGVQFGSLARKWNPQMRSYIYNKNSKFHVIDLQQIISSCEKVGKYLRSIVEKRETILFLSTKKQTGDIVKEQAIRCKMPYIVNKWKGGFLTNFEVIKTKLKELQGLDNFFQKDSFKNLIKKEQVILEKKRDKLQKVYEGVVNLRKLPGALFIIGLNKEKTALREAKKIGIPVIAICNTTCDPRLVDYVIPGNDESVKAIDFFANLVADAIIEDKKGESLKSVNEREEKKSRDLS